MAFGGINGFPQGRGDDTIITSDTLSWVRGKHTIKFGGEYRQAIADSFSRTPGTFAIPSIGQLSRGPGEFFYCEQFESGQPRIYMPSTGRFVQDAYKVSPRISR